jgi:hypothetical protein
MTVRDVAFTRAVNVPTRQKPAPTPFAKLQPFSEALPKRLLLLQRISSEKPAVVAVCVDPLESGRIGLSEYPHPPFRLYYQVEIRRLPISLIEESLTRSQPPTPATVKRDCGNCGVVT